MGRRSQEYLASSFHILLGRQAGYAASRSWLARGFLRLQRAVIYLKFYALLLTGQENSWVFKECFVLAFALALDRLKAL